MRLTSHNSHLSALPESVEGAEEGSEFADVCTYPLNENQHPQSLVDFYLTKSQARNTRQAYRSDLEQFAAWGGSIPAFPKQVASYLAENAEALAVSTLKRRMAAIAWVHKDQGQVDPTKSVLVKQVFKGIERHHGVRQKQATPLLLDTLEQIVSKMDGNAKDVRDQALLLVGFYGAFRGAELLGLRIQDCIFDKGGVCLHLAKSKTDQKANGRWVPLPRFRNLACPTRALENWIDVCGYDTDFLFRSMSVASGARSTALTVRSLSRLIQSRVKRIGIDPEGYSSHSLRAGFVTSQIEMGVDVGQIAHQTGHRSLEVLKRYDRPLAVRFSATPERLREFLPFTWNDKKVGNNSRKSISQSIKDDDSRVFQPPLQSADIGPVNPGINRQGLLGETFGDPELSKIMSHDTLNLHEVK